MPRVQRGAFFLSRECQFPPPPLTPKLIRSSGGFMRVSLRLICGMLLAVFPPSAGWAQEAAPFFKGKQIRILISAGVAGGYNEYARLLASHMGNHLAGKPDFIVQSMPGAGGLLATNYLFTQAPQDGTTIGLIHSSVPLAPLFGTQGARFDPQKFHWLGSMDP